MESWAASAWQEWGACSILHWLGEPEAGLEAEREESIFNVPHGRGEPGMEQDVD